MSKLLKVNAVAATRDGSGNVLAPNLTLELDALLGDFPAETRAAEHKQVTFVVLRNIALLRKLFAYYCAIGHVQQQQHHGGPDEAKNAATMTRFQLWRFLKDTKVHHHLNHNLAACDRALAPLFAADGSDPHSPTDKFGLQDFLKCCVALAYHIYRHEPSFQAAGSEANVLSRCTQQFFDDHLMNHRSKVGGQFLYETRHAIKALMYMENSWRVYQYCCHTYAGGGSAPAGSCAAAAPTQQHRQPPRMRQFLFMLRDMEILGKQLSTGTVLKVLAADDPFVCALGTYNMELEMTFLEFFEALIGCALCYGFDNLKLMRVPQHRDQQPQQLIDFPDLGKMNISAAAMRHGGSGDDFGVWSKQVQNFFTKILFPSWHNQRKITRAARLARVRSTVAVQSS